MGLFSNETTTKPWMPKETKKGLKDVTNDFSDYYKWVGKNPEKRDHVYTLPGYSSFQSETNDAFGGLTALAGANTGDKGMAPHLQEIMDGGGFNTGQRAQIDRMNELERNPFFDQTINGDGLSADQRLVADRYRGGMNEEFGTDAAYNTVKQNALDTQRMALEAQAAKAGRYGGGSSQSILAREQGNLGAGMDVGELDKWRARTSADAAALASLSQTGFGNRSSAVSQRAGLQGQIFNAEQAGLGNMTQAYDTAQKPLQTMRAVGAEKEAQDQKRINDAMRVHAAQDPMNRYREAQGFYTGTPTGSTQTVNPSLGQTIIGGGLGVLGLGAALGGWGQGTPTGGYSAGGW